MNNTSFVRDDANARLTVERILAAEPARVWPWLTDPELLDQWWAPAPWKTVTRVMGFRVGGHWLYSMRGPEGEEHFCDADGTASDSLPRQVFDTTLIDHDGSTRLVTVIQYASFEDMNTIIEMGMREGLSQAHLQLEGLLAG
jgi:uncharacterized protein YndB with AHSA1/START domain